MINPKNTTQNVLSDFDTNIFLDNLYLPMTNVGEPMIILASVSDKRGGITNIT